MIEEFKNRGILKDTTGNGELEKRMANGEKFTFYCGFDPTADSLHIGSLLPIMNIKRMIDAGHKAIVLIGGATGLIGDPSFKDNERSLNSEETVDTFKRGIQSQLENILGKENVIFVDNLSWTKNINIIDFLRDIGKHFKVNTMIAKESVKQRIEREGSGISFTEFTYQILQGMDFLKLKEMHGCNLQIGGSDQMGNITSGIDLIHRELGNKEDAFGLTTQLLLKEDGTKFGKSETGTVWLSKDKTSPFEFFQFLLKTQDKDVYRFLKFFSSMSVEEINTLEENDKASGKKPEAQEILAKELTKFVHGEKGLKEALKITEALLKGDFSSLSETEMSSLSKNMDTFTVDNKEINIVDALVNTNLATSKKMAREFIVNNAISLNNEKIMDVDFIINKEKAFHNKFIFLKRGKRNLACIIIK